ncbi:Uncharacterized protein HZ326_10819 [Fusarium oxysporum f. sp. albedinis]|nr:Uncharacterized protein HZ326_10819 [Fusarium oxysporum f. sp. albedinis]
MENLCPASGYLSINPEWNSHHAHIEVDAKSPKLHRRSHLQRPTHLLISPPIPQRRLLLNTPINALPQQAFNEKSPTRVKCSLYEYARSKATDEPDTWSDVHHV